MRCFQNKGDLADTIRILPALDRRYYEMAAPLWMIGLHTIGTDTNVLGWLKSRSPDTVLDLGTEQIGDSECRLIQFDNVAVNGQYLTRAKVWFDPKADWLPRQMRIYPRRVDTNEKGPPSLLPGEVLSTLHVQEFMQIEDKLLGRNRWFPKRAMPMDFSPTTVYEIESVQLNQPIDPQRFIPVPGVGTQIDDLTASNQQTVFGGEEGLRVRREMQSSVGERGFASRVPAAANNSVPVALKRLAPNARPVRNSTGWLFGVAIAILATILGYKMMCSRRL